MTELHVPAGEGPHHLMIVSDHVPKAAVRDAAGAFEDFASSVSADQPVEGSREAILSVTHRHGASFAGA